MGGAGTREGQGRRGGIEDSVRSQLLIDYVI